MTKGVDALRQKAERRRERVRSIAQRAKAEMEGRDPDKPVKRSVLQRIKRGRNQ